VFRLWVKENFGLQLNSEKNLQQAGQFKLWLAFLVSVDNIN
jgi:hypothetical protein